jgi:DNA primase
MNVAQVKQLRLPDVLARLGHQPQREAKGESWYLSPFRQEDTPSFKTDRAGKLWYDFGEGQGGGIIEFAQKYWRCSVGEALRHLADLYLSGMPTAVAPARPVPPSLPQGEEQSAGVSAPIEITAVQTLTNRALIGYLWGRGIDYKTARPYVREIHYTHRGKPYFALAFPNESGGYELRNPYYKGTYGAKDITLLHPVSGDTQVVAVFEGFMDFLSALTYEGRQEAETAVLVLNSAAMKRKAAQTIRQLGARRVYLYLDHDSAGEELAAYFQQVLVGMEIHDQSDLYAGYKDFNDFVTAERKKVRIR